MEITMSEKFFQDFYPDHWSHCYGCGRLNEHGYQIKSFWEGDETVAYFKPKSFHTAIPGYVYGGLLASLIDCHGTGTASAAMYREQRREIGSEPAIRFLTGSLNIKYIKPTPLGPIIELRGIIRQVKERKVIVDVSVLVETITTVKGEVIAIQIPDSFQF
jgi:acyl-coenzyme A thioesterase PaaI-like protein